MGKYLLVTSEIYMYYKMNVTSVLYMCPAFEHYKDYDPHDF